MCTVSSEARGRILPVIREMFDGVHGCYLYQGRGADTDKLQNLRGHMLVVGPHEGLVSSEIWLGCRIKLLGNKTVVANRKAVNTWLAGKVKCGHCGYALMSVKTKSGKQYLRCTRRLNNKACPGCGKEQSYEGCGATCI